MKVKLLVSVAGPETNWLVGDVVEVDDAYGQRMIEADPPQAIPYSEPASTKETRGK